MMLISLPCNGDAGHVMGLATWKAVLQEHQRCPFTKNPLSVEQVGAALLLWVLVSVIIFQLIAVIA